MGFIQIATAIPIPIAISITLPPTARGTQKRCGDRTGANKPDSVHRPKAAPIIHLSNLPGTLSGFDTRATRAASRIPYLILLQRGFALRRRSHDRPVVSYTTFSPLPGANAGRSVFCGTFRRRRSGSTSPALTTGPLALRSPDFPPLPKQERPVTPRAATAKQSYAAARTVRSPLWRTPPGRLFPSKKAPSYECAYHGFI